MLPPPKLYPKFSPYLEIFNFFQQVGRKVVIENGGGGNYSCPPDPFVIMKNFENFENLKKGAWASMKKSKIFYEAGRPENAISKIEFILVESRGSILIAPPLSLLPLFALLVLNFQKKIQKNGQVGRKCRSKLRGDAQCFYLVFST